MVSCAPFFTASAVETLEKSGYSNIEQHKKSLPPEEFKAAIAGAHFVGIRSLGMCRGVSSTYI
jgi:hypothetical protein